ncbi:MAG: bifunctional ornithine acetyltransferase/N-acetylglutamate synthase [Acidimicrobiales bacterium]
MSHAVSPLAPDSFPELPPIAGVSLATFAAGLRYQKRADLMLALLDEGTTVAGTLTRSLCPSAPVDWCRSILGGGKARAIVCNAGNANAFTGTAGQTAASHTATTIAGALGIPVDEVFLASTGVIGETLELTALDAGLASLVGELHNGPGASWEDAARAISTTDTYPKERAQRPRWAASMWRSVASPRGVA